VLLALRILRNGIKDEKSLIRIKDTSIYQIYLRLRYPQAWQKQKRQIDLLKRLVGADTTLAFDIGANRGEKAYLFAKIFKKVVCVEPDPDSADLLRERFISEKKVNVVQKGVSAKPGVLKFFQLGVGNPRNSFSEKWVKSQKELHPLSKTEKVKITTLEELIREHGIPGLLKVDVEGYEERVFRGLRTAIPCISFESNLPAFRSETKECVRLLTRLSKNYRFNYVDGEADHFGFKEWKNSKTFLKVIGKFKESYMEVYARTFIKKHDGKALKSLKKGSKR